MVVDMINDFVTGKFGSKQARAIIPKIAELLRKARQKGIPIIYLRDAHFSDDREISIWGEHAMKGSKGSEIIPELKPENNDIVIEKRWYSGFVGTELQKFLKDMGIDAIIFTGVSTEICVQNNVAYAYFLGYKTIVPKDCTASMDEESYEMSLRYMNSIFGTEITTSDRVLQNED